MSFPSHNDSLPSPNHDDLTSSPNNDDLLSSRSHDDLSSYPPLHPLAITLCHLHQLIIYQHGLSSLSVDDDVADDDVGAGDDDDGAVEDDDGGGEDGVG